MLGEASMSRLQKSDVGFGVGRARYFVERGGPTGVVKWSDMTWLLLRYCIGLMPENFVKSRMKCD